MWNSYRTVARNYIFGLIWRCYGPKRDILTIGEQSHILYDPILSYRKIKFYRVEKWIWEDPNGTTVSLGRFSYP